MFTSAAMTASISCSLSRSLAESLRVAARAWALRACISAVHAAIITGSVPASNAAQTVGEESLRRGLASRRGGEGTETHRVRQLLGRGRHRGAAVLSVAP